VFSNPRDAELVRWHSNKHRENDNEIQHPADGSQWKIFDLQHPLFATESRNIRFALSTDGMNPFVENRVVHITWLIILEMYNILTWLSHKRKYIMFSILIHGPKQSGIDIDVFLEPLVEGMEKLWNEGVHMWDQYQQEYFTLKAIIFVCIHDAPGDFTVSRHTKGNSRCPICVDRTALVYLLSYKKLVFMRHPRFLERKHMYRKMKRHFDNTIDKDSAPKWYTEKLLFDMVKNIQVVSGKGTLKG
jgi:hypothetical protein